MGQVLGPRPGIFRVCDIGDMLHRFRFLRPSNNYLFLGRLKSGVSLQDVYTDRVKAGLIETDPTQLSLLAELQVLSDALVEDQKSNELVPEQSGMTENATKTSSSGNSGLFGLFDMFGNDSGMFVAVRMRFKPN